jgi:lysine decarboxylase
VIAPNPPGVPVLVPGEIVTAEVLHALRVAARSGTRTAYAADPTLRTLQVVAKH